MPKQNVFGLTPLCGQSDAILVAFVRVCVCVYVCGKSISVSANERKRAEEPVSPRIQKVIIASL